MYGLLVSGQLAHHLCSDFFFISLSLFFFARLPALVDDGLDVRESLTKASEEKKGFPLLARREKKKNSRENKEFLALGTLRLEEYKHVTFLPSLPPFGFFNYGAGLQVLTYLII